MDFRELRAIGKDMKLLKTRPKNTNLKVLSEMSQITIINPMRIKCCYCSEWHELNQAWVVNTHSATLEAIVDLSTMSLWPGWTLGWKNVPLNMKHPHVRGKQICKGNLDAVSVLTLGMNPSSCFFDVKSYYIAIGHQCAPIGAVCMTHGFDCLWLEAGKEPGIARWTEGWACQSEVVLEKKTAICYYCTARVTLDSSRVNFYEGVIGYKCSNCARWKNLRAWRSVE